MDTFNLLIVQIKADLLVQYLKIQDYPIQIITFLTLSNVRTSI